MGLKIMASLELKTYSILFVSKDQQKLVRCNPHLKFLIFNFTSVFVAQGEKPKIMMMRFSRCKIYGVVFWGVKL